MIKPPDCNGCPLEKISDGFIVSEGEGTNGVVVLGEAGGWNEYIDGLPFRPYAQAGSKLEEVFREVSSQLSRPVTRSQFLIYNVVNCHPKGDKLAGMSYEQGAIAHCSRYVDAVVGGFSTDKIKTILALGNIPLKFLTGFSGIAEEKQSITHLRGFVYQGKYGLVVPGIHPSSIKRGNPHLTPLLVEDVKRAIAVANGTFTNFPTHPNFKQPKYNIAPSLEDAWGYYYKARDNTNLVIGYDIETPPSASLDEDERDELTSNEIVQIQFSLAMNEGIAFPYKDPYIEVAKLIMALPNVKAGHYVWHFDNPILKANEVIINGKIIDTLWMFKHHHPGLPRGLQNVASLLGFPFPWKHLFGINLPFYGCADVDAVQYILAYLPKLMIDRGIFNGYAKHVVKLNTIFQKATERGIPVSESKRELVKNEFNIERETINVELQKMIPDEVRNIKPKRKNKETGELDYGYLKEPKLVKEATETYNSIAPMLVEQHKKVVPFDVYVNRKYHTTLTSDDNNSDLVPAEFIDGDKTVKRWCVIEDFKASSTQLQKYLKYRQDQIAKEIEVLKTERDTIHKGRNTALTTKINELKELFEDYEVPMHLKTKRPTTSKQELEEIYFNTGDPVLEKTVRIRSLDTNLCIDPNARILTTTLEWIKAKNIKIGQTVIAFDEKLPEDKNNNFRYCKNTIVTGIHPLVKPRVQITTTKGSIICSDNHYWLANKYYDEKWGNHDTYEWTPANKLRIGGTISYFTDPWEPDNSYEAGYVAGFLDGEGSIAKGTIVRFGQSLTSTLNHVVKIISEKGYYVNVIEDGNGHANIYIGGKGYAGIRLIGSIRPHRLLLNASLENACINGRGIPKAIIQRIEPLPPGEVIAVQTEAKTFIVEGYHSHNCNYLPNWKPHKDGRVHPIYGYTAPSGQINSWSPNSQNCSKHTEYGKRFRAIIEALEGHCFVEADKKSFHIAVMGYNANDKDYIRFSQIDPHSIFGSHINPEIIGCSISLKWSDDEIKQAAAEFKKRSKAIKEKDPLHGIDVRQDLAKPSILGNQLELGAKKLQRQNQRYIHTVAEADKLQKMIAGLFGKPELYKSQIKMKAYNQRYLINEFGRIQYFYDVFHFQYDKRRLRYNRKDSDGAREPIAFRVQSPAFGMIDEELLELDRLGACEEHNFMVTIHDSLIFMPEIGKRDKCIELLHNVMSRPCNKLVNEATGPEGLKVNVDISVGQNWRDMEEIKV